MKRIMKPNHRKELKRIESKLPPSHAEVHGFDIPKITTLKQANAEITRLRELMQKEGLYTPFRRNLLAVTQRMLDDEKRAHNDTRSRLFRFEHAVRDAECSILRRAQLAGESSEALRDLCHDLSVADGISKYNGIRAAALIKKALDSLKDEHPKQACDQEQEAQAQA